MLWPITLFYTLDVIYHFNSCFLNYNKTAASIRTIIAINTCNNEIVSVNSLTLIGSFASSLVLQILDHNKQRIEYLPNSVSRHVNCIYLIASLKRNVGCNWNSHWDNRQKCVGRILFFTFFSLFLFSLAQCRLQNSHFLRIQVRRASSQKKGLEPG